MRHMTPAEIAAFAPDPLLDKSTTLERARRAMQNAGSAFKVMTRDGPLSMCLHNAKRDSYILQPIRIPTWAGDR